jgi:hypothetical protein
MLDGIDQWLWPQQTPKPYPRTARDDAARDAWRAQRSVAEYHRIEDGRDYFWGRERAGDIETAQLLKRYKFALKIENALKWAENREREPSSYSYSHLGPSENRWQRVAYAWLMRLKNRNLRQTLIAEARDRTAPYAQALWNELERKLPRSRRLAPRHTSKHR